jgi:hypothetical protein
MEKLKIDEFRKLLFVDETPCVSIYVDAVCGHNQASMDRIDTAVSKATSILRVSRRHPSPDALLAPARTLLAGNVSRLSKPVGIGIFISPTTQAFVCLPAAPRERVVVADSFHLKPVMKALASGVGSFAILALSLRGAHFFESDAGSVHLTHTLPLDRRAREHLDAAEVVRDSRTLLRQYLRRIDRAVRGWIGRGRRPLILAGPAYLRALYREVNTYPYLINDGFALDAMIHIDALYARALRVLSTTIERSITQDLAALRDVTDDPNVTFDVKTASKWVALGLVDKMFVADDATIRGSFDGTTGEIILHEVAGSDCVLDDLAEEVLRKGGRVVCVPQSGLPKRALLAAFRGGCEISRLP